MKIRSLLCALFLIATSVGVFAQGQHTRIDSLMKAVHGLGIFNGNVLVMQSGKVVYQASLGYADATKSHRLAKDMLFDVGSISKEFSAAALLLLEEKGKLSVQDPLRKFLPELPLWADSVRLMNLINYTSGLPLTAAKTDADNFKELKLMPALVVIPGSTYAYSYSNVLLQRMVVEKLSGLSYADFVMRYLFKPLGMKAARVDFPVNSNGVARAFDSNFKETNYNPAAQGWIRTDATDLYKWVAGLDAGKLLKPASLRILGTSFGDGESALGKAVFIDDRLMLHQHHGSNYNYEALVTHATDQQLMVVLLTNSQQFKVHAINKAIMEIMAGKPYVLPKRSLYLDLREKVLEDFDQGMKFYAEVMRSGAERYDLSFVIADVINTGKHLMRRQRYQEAVDLFLLGTNLAGTAVSDQAFACQLAADCYLKLDKISLSRLYLEKCLSLDPENKQAAAQLESLIKSL